jgi:Uma2 family endonuclease
VRVAVSVTPHRWTLADFLRAWEAGAITDRVELLDGEIWDVSMGPWHGEVTATVIRTLPNKRFRITTASLASDQSLPLPDCWVLRRDATPLEQLSRRMPRWAPADVLLVVEVSDETIEYDLGAKALLYARAGYAHYWVVTPDGVHVHVDPTAGGYGRRVLHRPGQSLSVPYTPGVTLDVAELIDV